MSHGVRGRRGDDESAVRRLRTAGGSVGVGSSDGGVDDDDDGGVVGGCGCQRERKDSKREG